MKLPVAIRESVVVQMDEWFENENDNPDAMTLAEQLIRALEFAVEEQDIEDVEDIVGTLESDGELEEPLVDTLEAEFNRIEELDLTGEEVVAVLDRVCTIQWSEDADMMDDIEEMDVDEEDEEDEEDEY